MAKISLANSGKYSSGATNDFFTLADDGDIARVRFLYEEKDGSDVDYFLVHEVEVDGKKRYAACLALDEEGNLHSDDCPLCQAGYKRIEKLFLQVYVEEEDRVKTWDRGKTFVSKIMTYINRYGSLVSQPIEIERKGKKGSTNTTYEMFPLEKDGKTVADFPEKQDLLGTFILDVTAEDCEDILAGTYVIPGSENNSNNSGGATRRESSSRRESTQEPAPSRSRRSAEPKKETESQDSAPKGRRTRRASGGSDSF